MDVQLDKKWGEIMLSSRLRFIRKKRGLTQPGLAEKVNTTKATISNYENNHSTPSNDMLIQLAKALNTTTDYLLGSSNNPTRDIERENEDENIFFFDEENITPEEMEELKKHLDYLRYKAAQENKKK